MRPFLPFSKSRLRLLLTTLALAFIGGRAAGQYADVPVTGFNADEVANGVGPAANLASTTAVPTNGLDNGAFVFIDGTYQFSSTCSTTTTGVLPASGQISSTTAPGLVYNLQPYTGLNDLRLPSTGTNAAGTGTLTLVTPTSMARLYLLVVAGSGPITNGISVSVTFTDATTQTLLTNGSAADWCSNTTAASTTPIPQQYNRVDAAVTTGTCGGGVSPCQYFHEMSLPLPGNTWSKQVASITISKTVTTGIFNVFAAGMQSPCTPPADQATTLIQGNTTISLIEGSFTAATSAPSGYLVVRYPIGATPADPADGTTYTTGQALGGGTVVQSGTATTFTASGLTGGSAYDFYVYAYNTGSTCGGPAYNTATPLVSTFFTSPCSGGLFGTYTVGPNGVPYNTLTAALADIASFGVSGPVVLELESAYSSTVETFPLTLAGNACISAANSVTIRPAAGATALSISSSAATTIDINNGGSFFTIDGRPGGVGATAELTIQNTSTTGAAVRLTNGATSNRITYCNLQGVNTASAGGVVQFTTTTGTNGNSGNAITFCNISGTSASNTPATLVYSTGSTGNAALYNSNDTVANCNLFDFFSTAEANAFKIGGAAAGSSAWVLTNNSIYQTTARTGLTVAALHYAFNLNSPLGAGFVVSGNYIGGSAPQCGGAAWTSSSSGNFRFLGAFISQQSGGAPNTFSGNTFANFDWTNSSATVNTAPGAWAAIQVIGGPWAVTGNTIGSTAGNSITLTTAAASPLYGIIGGSGNANTTYDISGNTVAGLTTNTTSSTTVAVNILGISVTSGVATTTYNISGNTIGSALPNSLFAARATTGAQVVRGIENIGAGRVNITGNTVQNLANVAVATGLTVAQTIGIATTSGVDSIAGNTVRALTNAAQQTNLGTSAAVIGISQASTTAGSSVNKNTVFALHSIAAAGGANVIGINQNAATTGTNGVAGNFVHSLSSSSPAAAASLIGISVTAGASNVQNNMVRVGIDSTGTDITAGYGVYGIYETGGTNNYYHNSVYTGGAAVASATNTAGFFSASTTTTARAILNNIFFNARSNASGPAPNYGTRVANTTNLTSNGNVVFANGTGGNFGAVGATNYATLQMWQAATSQDGLSASANPQFVAPTASSSGVDLHINPSAATPVEGAGVTVASVTDDFDGQSRAALSPVDIGADAGNFIALDVLAPTIAYTPIASTYNTGSQTITATIADATGVPTSGANVPRIYYKKMAAGTFMSVAGTFVSGTAQNGVWSFTIDPTTLGGLMGGDSVIYYIVAQDLAATPNVGSNPAGVVATDVNTVTTHPAGNAFRILAYLNGVVNVGVGQSIPTLTGAGGLFQQIAANGLSGDLTAVVTSDLAEPGTFALAPYLESGAGGYKVSIVPDGTTERVISGAVTSPGLIRFDGVRGAKIDGAFGGSGRYLRLRNSNGGGSTITFVNDAKRDTVMNCFVEGNNTSTGNILFNVGAAGGSGNDSNVITGNVIRELTNIVGPTNTGISSSGSAAPLDNSENIISNNEFVNCIFNAVNLNATGTGNGWQITDNKVYYTTTLINSGMGILYLQNGNGHLISGNSIGGSAPDRSGAALTNTTIGTINAIQLAVAAGTPTVVSNNLISNIFSGGPLNAVNLTSGTATISGNIIGGGAQPYDTLRSAAASGYITIGGGTATVSGNVVKNGSYYAGAGVRTAGILLSGGTGHVVSGNTVDNVKANSTGTTNTSGVFGIAVAGGTGHTISSNTISNIYNTNAGTLAYFVAGMAASSSTGSTWSRNRVYNIYAAGTGTATSPVVYGMYMTSTATETIVNNQISVGANTVNQTRVYGIQDVSAVSTGITHNYFNNTVYVSGTTAAGTNNSYAFQRTSTGTMNLRNNILYNGRTTAGTGFNYALGISNTSGFTAAASNYNLLVVPDTTRLVESGTAGQGVGAYNATFTALPNANWMAGAGAVTPTQLFTDVTTSNLSVVNTAPECWYVNGKGIALAAVPTDYDANPRSTTIATGATDIGSTEFSTATVPPSAAESAPPAVSTTNFYTFAGRRVAVFNWDASGTPPAALDVKYYTGTDAPNILTAPRFNAHYDITASGGTGYGYTVDLSYDSSILGTVPNSADARLAKYDAGVWVDYPASSANPVTGFLSSNTTLNSFSIFTGASAGTPLILTQLEIAATAEGAANRIDWSASHSRAGGRFAVQRSADGFGFVTLAEVSAGGATRYSHRDAQPLSGTSYYRVALTDAGGAVSFSKTVSVRRSAAGDFVIAVSPNPVVDVARVTIAGDVPADARILITDLAGRTIAAQAATAGMMEVDMRGVPAGTYILQYKAAGRSEAVKVLKR